MVGGQSRATGQKVGIVLIHGSGLRAGQGARRWVQAGGGQGRTIGAQWGGWGTGLPIGVDTLGIHTITK